MFGGACFIQGPIDISFTSDLKSTEFGNLVSPSLVLEILFMKFAGIFLLYRFYPIMPGKCKFNDLWLCSEDQTLVKWLSPVTENKFKAYCKLCKSIFDISHSGINSVRVHAKGKKHVNIINSLLNVNQMPLLFAKSCANEEGKSANKDGNSAIKDGKPGNEDENQDGKVAHNMNVQPENKDGKVAHDMNVQPAGSMKKYLVNDQVIKAEIMWALNAVINHNSNRNAGDASDLFKIMFPDSIIAEKFQMHKDKLAYVITYGLGPYFQDQLSNDLRKLEYFCISLDESLNKVAQKGQMDIIVRFWDEVQVSTRYLSSMFLGHSKAADLLDAFTACLSDLGLPLRKILQVETDGPNVNLKFLRDFDQHIKNEHDSSLFDVGTCSLHVLHGCYKTALVKSKWAINDFLRAAYYLFKDFPSRRADYQHFSGSSLYPLKLCAIRWIENSNVIERAIKILPFLKLYVEGVQDQPPATKNFERVSSFLSDKLLLSKLYFLQSVTTELETFLVFFQSDKPLLPHLYEELALLFKKLASRVLKKEVVSCKNLRDMLLIDLSNKDNYLSVKNIDVGFGAASASSVATGQDKIIFFRECRHFLLDILQKMKIKSPLAKTFLKGVSCFSPQIMLASDEVKSNRVALILNEFIDKKHLTPIQADSVKNTYLKICEDPIVKGKLEGYDMEKDRLDKFLMDVFKTLHEDDVLLTITKKVLTMFHGNAAVERSFSINKKCLVENLEENSLVAQRSVQAAIMHYGSIRNVPISAGMINSVQSASGRRKDALVKKKQKQDAEVSEKKLAASKLKEMRKRKLEIMQKANAEVEQLDNEILQTEKKIKKHI